jgi:quercetin 2,3-dioxygenase
MRTIRRAEEIYRKQGGWFDARWHFSFDEYRDPEWMGVGALRVFNDDRLVPGAIWPMHPHRDIEGLTYVAEGTFRHEDDIGTGGVLPAGSVQRMTLGRGAHHSEQNASETEPMRFIQLWILPDTGGLEPSAEQRVWSKEDHRDRLHRVMGPGGGDAVVIHQDASVEVGLLSPGVEAAHDFGEHRGGYLYVIGGRVEMDGETLATGDAVRLIDEPRLELRAAEETELILVDVPLEFEPVGVWARRRPG